MFSFLKAHMYRIYYPKYYQSLEDINTGVIPKIGRELTPLNMIPVLVPRNEVMHNKGKHYRSVCFEEEE